MNHLNIIIIIAMLIIYHSIMSCVALIICYHASMLESNHLFAIKTHGESIGHGNFDHVGIFFSDFSCGWLKKVSHITAWAFCPWKDMIVSCHAN